MKVVKRIVEYLIAIAVIPAIALTVKSATELKDVRNVQYQLLSEEEGIFNITQGTYEKLVANKRIKNYELESNYPLITQEEMERATWKVNDDLKNEIYIDENGEKRIRLNVGQITLDGSEQWWGSIPDRNNEVTEYYYVILPKNINAQYVTGEYEIVNAYAPGFKASSNFGVWSTETTDEVFTIADESVSRLLIRIRISKERLNGKDIREYLSQNPLTITYELMIKNPNNMVIESNDLYVTSDYVRMTKPNDFSGSPDGLLLNDGLLSNNIMSYIDRYEVTDNWIYVYPKDITVEELANRMVGKTLIYELAQPRPVEVYDFSKFRLVFHKNRIRVTFDVDDGYYLWEITKDDKMIPINGQYDLGNIWTVKFYVYEIQQPLIRNLVLLIPLIVVGGLLVYMMNKKDFSL